MNVTVKRGAGNIPYPQDIVDELLTTEAAGIERGRAEINDNDTSRKIIKANGPKNNFMYPTMLVEVRKGGKTTKGILNMFARTYDKEGNNFTVTSSVEVEVQI